MDKDASTIGTSVNVAQIIVVSVVSTVIILGVLLFSFRSLISDYFVSRVASEVARLTPEPPVIRTNEEQIVQAIMRVNPAVVSIIVTKDVPVYEQYFETFNPGGWFGTFSIPRIRESGTEEQEVGGGTGFIVSTDGLVVTNRHVVDDESARYSIIMTDGSVYAVDVVDRDEQLDIAILKLADVPEARLPTVVFGDSEELRLGQTVIAIGNALAEFQNSVSVGVISGLGRSIMASDSTGNIERLNEVIQTDAAINLGNSGGPLLNISGEVIGVNVATSQGADNIGFALPASAVKQVVDSVRMHGEIIRPYLGVRYVMLDEVRSSDYGTDQSYGALLYTFDENFVAVEKNSPADKAHLQAGDIIIALDNESLFGKDLATELRQKQVSATVEITYLRAGEENKVEVTLVEAL